MTHRIPHISCSDCSPHKPRSLQDWVELAGMLALIVVLGKLLGWSGVGTAALTGNGVTGLGTVFLLGLAASLSSCLSLVGGLLLSLSATWREFSEQETPWRRLQPLLLFNGGRLLGFFILGGAIGLLGAAFHPSPRITGILTVLVAAAMVLIGLHLLRLLPRLHVRNPFSKHLNAQMVRLTRSGSTPAAFLLGALTFFIPCGFTQSTQLLALGAGSFLGGALIMTTFALGTLPSLIGISIVSSLARGKFLQWFFAFSGMLVVVLGLLNLKGGLLLLNIDVQSLLPSSFTVEQDPNVAVDAEGKQIVSLTVTDQGYQPGAFTIRAGRETWIRAYAPLPVGGCATFLQAPAFNIQTPIAQGENWLGPIVNPQNDFVLTCSMGMFRADVHVIP